MKHLQKGIRAVEQLTHKERIAKLERETGKSFDPTPQPGDEEFVHVLEAIARKNGVTADDVNNIMQSFMDNSTFDPESNCWVVAPKVRIVDPQTQAIIDDLVHVGFLGRPEGKT
jgi:hypothetical protein